MVDRIEKIKQMLEESPRDLFLKHALALEYIKAEHESNARLLFEEILADDPGYVGTYYHFGKLLERQHEMKMAEKVYEKGIAEAMKAGDRHAASELRSALEDIRD